MENDLKKIGNQTIKLNSNPKIISTYSIVGPKEGQGPLGEYFHEVISDDTLGKDSFEKAESEMMYTAIKGAINNANIKEEDIDYLFAGDLLNQITSSGYAARDLNIPFFGLYGACSTMSESLSMAALFIDGSFAKYVVASTSSHFSSAERQFRFPLEYGSQRAPTAQWTVTGSGAMVLSKEGDFPMVTYITTGIVKDYGEKDANNMGAAMAPAFADTLVTHFLDTGRNPSYYDAIISGDLGYIGKDIAIDIAKSQGYNIKPNYNDCGVLMFDKNVQDTHSGGSGCACCGTVFSGYLFKQLKEKKIKKLLLIATGALMNSTSSQQGESIPGVAHAISIEL